MAWGLNCCGSARGWTRVIAWIQIIGSAFGLLLSGGGLITVLLASEDVIYNGSNESTDNSNSKDTPYDSDLNKLGSTAYLKLVIILVLLVMVLFPGVILGVFLLKGANESKSRYLKWWVGYAVMMWVGWVGATIVSTEDTWVLVGQLSVFSSLYCFWITVVIVLIREVEVEEEGCRRDEPPGSKHPNPKAYPIKV